MKTLRLIQFTPALGRASRYWEENEFRRDDELLLTELTGQQQQIVSGAMAWAAAQLPDGFSELKSVELRKVSDVITEWSTPEAEDQPPVPLAYSPAFVASIIGAGQFGQRQIEINSVPGPETNGLAALWESLAQ